MNRILAGAIAATTLLPLAAEAGPNLAVVSNSDNAGPGSLRAALGSGASVILIKRQVGTIAVTETLEYAGTDRLRIVGSGQTVDGSGLTDNSAPIFEVSQGADLVISNLSFYAGGGYDIFNPGGGKGIFVDVPEERTGTVSVRLSHVSVSGTGNHGVHISDCTLGDDCGGGSGGGGNGSPASIDVNLYNVTIDGAGFGKADADGIRVDERAGGDIFFSSASSTFMNVGADGVELDEGNDGSVFTHVVGDTYYRNGAYCAPIDPPIPGSPCDDEGDVDVDDGFDIDEAGDGSIYAQILWSHVIDNFDEGLDFDEEDDGGFEVKLTGIYASGNEDEGIKLSEEGEGDVQAKLRGVIAVSNNGSKEDIEAEEENGGDVRLEVRRSTVDKFKATEDGDGDGTLRIRGSNIPELELENVDQI